MDRAARGFREAGFFLAGPRDADLLPATFFVAEDFLFAATAGRRDAERRRAPALRALDFFRAGERLRPRAAAPVVRFLLELRRDDFLAAAMIQLRGRVFR